MSGNVKCFTGGHAALGLLAIIILTLCVAVIPLSLAYNMGWIKVGSLLNEVKLCISDCMWCFSVHEY